MDTCLRRLPLLVFALSLVVAAAPGLANDLDLLATTVPATACQPSTHGQSAKVRLSNGAWVFSGNAIGTVRFYCPLPINNRTVIGNSNDNDISFYRVYYRDSDGMGSGTSVRVRLLYRRSDGLYAGGSWFTSNSSTATGNTTRWHQNTHDVRSDALYSFYVVMKRSNSDESAVFSGIDFPLPAIP